MKKGTLWAAAFYVTFYAAFGSVLPYLTEYFRRSGVEMRLIGILVAIPTAMFFFASPIWSALADSFHIHKRLLPLAMLLTIPFALLLAWVHTFTGIFIAVTLYSLCFAPVISLSDYAVLSMLGDQHYNYGRLRMWGAVGYGSCAWVTGLLVQRFGINTVFYIFTVLMVFAVYTAAHLPQPAQKPAGEPYLKSLAKVGKNLNWLGLLSAGFLSGIGITILANYFVIFLLDLGASASLYGFSVAASSLSEIPFFLFAPLLLKRFSPRGVIQASLGALALRCLLCAITRNPFVAIGTQLLHGASFSAFWSAGVSYSNDIAPAGLGASAQALFGAVYNGLAGILGALIGGGLYAVFGPQPVFAFTAAAALVGWVVFALLKQPVPAARPVSAPE